MLWTSRLAAAALACTALVGGCQATPEGNTDGGSGARADSVRVALDQPLPALDGNRLRVSVVEVIYGPGGSSPPHRHRCPVIGYVAEGELRSRLQGESEAVYRAGDTFYESPGDEHVLSANASNTEPVRFVATFICDGEGPRTLPAAIGWSPRGSGKEPIL